MEEWMKITISINSDGLEALAKGGKLYPWHFSVTIPESSLYAEPNPKHIVVAQDVEISIPSTEEAATKAVEHLKSRMADVRAEAYKEEMELQTRINDLLMIGYSQPKEAQND
jgi:hypothetical protein